jgi:hypothetical protein
MLVDDLLSARSKSGRSITTYPERWKSQDAFLYYFISTPTPFNHGLGPVMGRCSSYSRLTLPENVLFNGLPYAKL